MSAKLTNKGAKVTVDIDAIENELKTKTTEEIRKGFFDCYVEVSQNLARCAVHVKVLKSRGESLHDIPMGATFLRIASGQIRVDLVWSFWELPASARRLLESLPLDEQDKLIDNPNAIMVETKANGGYDQRMVDLRDAPLEIIKQVVGPTGVRSPEEQMVEITRPKRASAPSNHNQNTPIKEPLNRSITVKLTESELYDLNANAANARVTPAEYARRGLVQSGVLERPKKKTG